MAEQTGIYVGTQIRSTTGRQVSDVSYNGGRVRVVADFWQGDPAQNDTVLMAVLPSKVILLPTSQFWWTDAGTTVDANIGTFNRPGKTVISDDATSLTSALNISTADGDAPIIQTPLSSSANTALKPLWAIAGETSDPFGDIEIQLTLVGANPDQMGLLWVIQYTID